MIVEIVASLSVIVASFAAMYGIGAWKREFQGKRNIEIAEEVLAMFYQARDAIRAIRNPLGYMGEGRTRKPQENEIPAQKAARDRAYVVYERFEKRQEIFNKLNSKRYQFAARFGADKTKPFDDLVVVISKVLTYADLFPETRIRAERRGIPEDERIAKTMEAESMISGTGDPTTDEIAADVVQVVGCVETICRPIIMEGEHRSHKLKDLWSKAKQIIRSLKQTGRTSHGDSSGDEGTPAGSRG